MVLNQNKKINQSLRGEACIFFKYYIINQRIYVMHLTTELFEITFGPSPIMYHPKFESRY